MKLINLKKSQLENKEEIVKPTPAPWNPSRENQEEETTTDKPVSVIVATLEKKNTQYGPLTFFVLRNVNPSISQDIGQNGLGFKFFKHPRTGEATWSMSEKKAREYRRRIEEYGINTSALDFPPIEFKQDTSDNQIQTVPVIENIPEEFKKWKSEIESVSSLSPDKRKEKYFEIIKRALNKVGDEIELSETQETSQKILKSLLNASSKFHNYSFMNSMLIAILRPGAQYVTNEKIWRKMGRIPNPNAVRIPIVFPIFPKTVDLTDEQKAQMTNDDLRKWEYSQRVRFGLGTAIAYEDTSPIPNWKNKKGEGPFEPPEWRINSNDPTPWLQDLYNASYKWATEIKKFHIDIGKLRHTMGGYAALGGQIVINDKYDGINKVSTLFHEIAHQLIHFDPKFVRQESEQADREADAEATSYVVCSHYHIENKDSPLYLASYKVDRAKLLSRLSYIQKAASEMFEGIDNTLEQITGEIKGEPQETATKDITSFNIKKMKQSQKKVKACVFLYQKSNF